MAKIVKRIFFSLFFLALTLNAAPLQLKSYKGNDATLEFIFDRSLSKNDFTSSELKNPNNLRKIIDIKAVNRIPSSKIKNSKIKEIRLAQFNAQTTRIVFEDNKDFDLITEIQNNKLIIQILNNINTKTSQENMAIPNKVIPKSNNVNNKIIVLDPGHGGKDIGASGFGYREKDITLKIALKLGEILKSRGYTVYFTRQRDNFVTLRYRTGFANQKAADLFVSIHINSTANKTLQNTLQGLETYFLSPTRSERSKEAANLENKSDTADMDFFSKQTFLNVLNREKIIASNKLAIDIQKQALASIRTKYQVKDGGVREAPFWVLVGALMPAVLVEVGYISNQSEAKKLINKDYQTLVAKGIADGIELYFKKNP